MKNFRFQAEKYENILERVREIYNLYLYRCKRNAYKNRLHTQLMSRIYFKIF